MDSREIFNNLNSSAKEYAKGYADKYPAVEKNYRDLVENVDQQYGEYWVHPKNMVEVGEGNLILLKTDPERLYLSLVNKPISIQGVGLVLPALDLYDLNVEGMSYESAIRVFPIKEIPADLVVLSLESARKMKEKDTLNQKAGIKRTPGRPLAAAKKTKTTSTKPEKKPKETGAFLDLSGLDSPQPQEDNPDIQENRYKLQETQELEVIPEININPNPEPKTKASTKEKKVTKPAKKEKPVLDLGIDIQPTHNPQKEEGLVIELTKEDKAKTKENLETARALAKKNAEKKKIDPKIEEIRQSIYTNLVNRCKFKIREMGYGNSESTAICANFETKIAWLSNEVLSGKYTEGESLKEISDSVVETLKPPLTPEEALKGAPVATPQKPKTEDSGKGEKTNVFDALLSYTCLQVMQNYGQDFSSSLTLCEERSEDIKRLSRSMERGELTPLQAARELENIIVSKSHFTHVKTVRSDVAIKDTSKGMEVSDRNARKARVELVNATARALEKRGLSSQLIEGVGKQVPIESQFKIKLDSAAVVIDFNGPLKPPGMSQSEKIEWNRMVYQKYIRVLIDEFDVNIKEGKGGNFAAYFTASYDEETDLITLIQGAKKFINFRETLHAMRARFPENELFISVDSALFHGWNTPDSPEGDLLKIA